MTKFFICHYCCDYLSGNHGDMKKHFKRKNKCVPKRDIEYSVARKLSVHKKFYIDFDHTRLTSDYLIYITHKYKLFENYISNNFLTDEVSRINIENINMYHSVYDIFNHTSHTLTHNTLTEIDQSEITEVMFRELYWNEEKQKFVCKKCFQGYTTKRCLLKHFDSNKCEKNLKIQKLIMDNLRSTQQISPAVIDNIIEESGVQNIVLNFEHNLPENEEEEAAGAAVVETDEIESGNQQIMFNTIPNDFYDVDYEMEEFYQDTKGYIYVIRLREFAGLNKHIYKIGYTLEHNVFKRINHYPNGSELLGFFYVIDAKRYESCIFDELDKLYFDKDALRDFKRKHGNEYYDIDPIQLYNVIHDVIRGGLIKKGDIINEIKKGKFRKLSLFYNDLFNKNISNMINTNMDIIKSYSYEERCIKFKELCENIINEDS